MTIEERINDDLRQLSAEFQYASWHTSNDEKPESDNSEKAPSTSKGKNETDLKNKASRLLDLMISLGEIERRGGGRKGQ